MAPFAFSERRDQSAVFQRFHMMGKRGLSDLHLLQKFTSALFAVCQKLNDLKPVGIGQCLTDQADLSQIHRVPRIDKCRYDHIGNMDIRQCEMHQ